MKRIGQHAYPPFRGNAVVRRVAILNLVVDPLRYCP
jgi:hypothetical protein